MQEHGMYFGKNELYDIIRKNGGIWNDAKERPIICLIKSIECDNLYWAIPVGNYEHRDEIEKKGFRSILILIRKIFVLVFIILEIQMKSLYFL